MAMIETIKTTYDQLKPILEDETVRRYGSMLIKVGSAGAKKVMGHLESRKANNTLLLTAADAGKGASQLVGGEVSSMAQQLVKTGGSAALGGLTSLGWANLAMTGVSIGVTVASTVILSKKIDNLSREIQQINGKLDGIINEMHEIKIMVAQLNDNEIRKLYKETSTQIAHMQHWMSKLSTGNYSEYIVGESEKALIEASNTLSDNLGRYNDPNCDICLGLDIIMAHFYAFVSLMKAYMSYAYLHEKRRNYGTEYDNILRNMCSKSMIESIQTAYRQSLSVDAFVSPTDIGLLTAVYKGIMVEQISEVKSQRKIIELVDYNEYKRINEKMEEDPGNSEVAFLRYA